MIIGLSFSCSLSNLSALFTDTEVFSLYVAVPNEELMHIAEYKKDWLLFQIQKLGVKIDELKVFQKGNAVMNYDDYSERSGEKSWIADA